MKKFIVFFALAFGLTLQASDKHVWKSGSDSNTGATNSPYLTVQKAIDNARAGDTIYFNDSTAQTYAENTRHADWAGSAGSYITINGFAKDGTRTKLKSTTWEQPYIRTLNCDLSWQGASIFGSQLYIAQTGSFCILSNNIIDMGFHQAGFPVLRWNGAASIPFGTCGSDNLIISNVFKNVQDEMVMRVNGYRNVITGNQLLNVDNTDYFQVAGGTNYILNNVCSNLFFSGVYSNNHADFFQAFCDAGGSFQASMGHLVESNIVVKADKDAQLGNLTDDSYAFAGGITFRNNLFVGISSKISIAMPNVKFYNNTFIDCATNENNGGAILIFSDAGSIGHGNGGQCFNNAFLNCGLAGNTNNNNGWYYFDTTLTGVAADSNYVAKYLNGGYQAVIIDPSHRAVGAGGGWDKFSWWEPNGINGPVKTVGGSSSTINGDPKFSNPAQIDYRLLAGSPLIGAGGILSGDFTVDIRGEARGSAWDIGAYEYRASDFNVYPGDVGPRLIQATTTVASGATTINIPYNLDRLEIKIGRRMATNKVSAWTVFTNLYTLNSAAVTNTISFADTNIANRTYEYEIQQLIKTNVISGDPNNAGYRDFAYPWAGYRVPLQDARGNVCLLVESGVAASLVSELARLKLDLQGAGYKVYRHDVAADEVGSGTWKTNVVGIKSLIQTDYNSDANPWFVFIVGHVPVPYSGIGLTPGSHTDNVGAHGTDLYYADLDGTFTDTGNTSATDGNVPATFTHNAAGDGKFDQDTIPSAPEVRIGRVDIGHSNFSAFSNTEVQRLKQYLDRDHAWRHKQFTVRNKAVIYYGPNPGLQVDAKPLEGHDLMAGYFGNTTSVDLGSWLPLSYDTNNTYLFALEMGEGAIDRSIQLGTSANFASSNLYAVFTSSYGSYYGSWDSMNTNAYLKSILANGGYPLTTSYRENYVNIGSSAMDEPISYEEFAEQSQFSLVGSGKEYTWYIRVIGGSGVTSLVNFPTKMFESLFGDPTLTTHQVAPVANLAANASGADNVVTWTASADASEGYHIYRFPTGDLNSPTRLTSVPTTSTSYTDTGASSGTYTYMVRAVKEDGLPNRSFYDASQGLFVDSAPVSGGAGIPQLKPHWTGRGNTTLKQ